MALTSRLPVKFAQKGQFGQNSLKALKFVMDIYDHGYCLPFETHCPLFKAKNNASRIRNKELAGKAIEKFIKATYIRG